MLILKPKSNCSDPFLLTKCCIDWALSKNFRSISMNHLVYPRKTNANTNNNTKITYILYLTPEMESQFLNSIKLQLLPKRNQLNPCRDEKHIIGVVHIKYVKSGHVSEIFSELWRLISQDTGATLTQKCD